MGKSETPPDNHPLSARTLLTDEEIIRLGYRTLMEKLGPSGFIRFVNLHNPPEGDYTQMDKPINHMTVEEIYAEAARLERESRGN